MQKANVAFTFQRYVLFIFHHGIPPRISRHQIALTLNVACNGFKVLKEQIISEGIRHE